MFPMAIPAALSMAGGRRGGGLGFLSKINPMIGSQMLGFGGDLVSGMLGSGNPYERYNKLGAEALTGMLNDNSDVINPGMAMALAGRARSGRMRQLGDELDATFGFNTGKSRGQLATNMLGADTAVYGDAYQTNQIEKARRKKEAALALAQLGGGNYA